MTTQWITDVEAMLDWLKAHDVPTPYADFGGFTISTGGNVETFRAVLNYFGEYEKEWSGNDNEVAVGKKQFGLIWLRVICNSKELQPPIADKPMWSIETDQQ